MVRLNVGCGRSILPGWINLDMNPVAGIDIVADLEQCRLERLPLDDGSVDEFFLGDVLEHIRQPLPLMEELHRIAKPGARMTIRCPYGASDDAFEDPTHARPVLPQQLRLFFAAGLTGARTMATVVTGSRRESRCRCVAIWPTVFPLTACWPR